MLQIADFVFPEPRTVVQVNMIEAKSKVRKEIRIRSLLREGTPTALEEQTALLRNGVEAFDWGQASLSLHTGRYYRGRRRDFQLYPLSRKNAAWVDLLILTNDRYERSQQIHEIESDTTLGTVSFQLNHQGNWKAPLWIQIDPQQSIDSLQIECNGELFTMVHAFEPGSPIEIDSEHRQVKQNSESYLSYVEGQFPSLAPDSNSLQIQIEPQTSTANCLVQFRDVWV